jgi:hypothetical protein
MIRTPFQTIFGILPTPVHNWIYHRNRWYRKHWGIGIRL